MISDVSVPIQGLINLTEEIVSKIGKIVHDFKMRLKLQKELEAVINILRNLKTRLEVVEPEDFFVQSFIMMAEPGGNVLTGGTSRLNKTLERLRRCLEEIKDGTITGLTLNELQQKTPWPLDSARFVRLLDDLLKQRRDIASMLSQDHFTLSFSKPISRSSVNLVLTRH